MKVSVLTSPVVRRMQACFTTRMTTYTPTRNRRESIYDKADRLLSEADRFQSTRSVRGVFWVGTVHGDHGSYVSFAVSPEFMDEHGISGGRVGCTCPSGRREQLCSHALCAEHLRKLGELEGDE